MKFSRPAQLCIRNFGAGASDQPASKVLPWAENGLFLENLSLPELLSYRGVTYLFGTSGPGLKIGAKF
jgi:hypothetical protein